MSSRDYGVPAEPALQLPTFRNNFKLTRMFRIVSNMFFSCCMSKLVHRPVYTFAVRQQGDILRISFVVSEANAQHLRYQLRCYDYLSSSP